MSNRKRERYIEVWTSRMGEEAANSAYDFRMFGSVAGWLMLALAGGGAAAMLARNFPLAYTVYGIALLVAAPLTFCTIRPLHKALTIVRKRYGLPSGIRMPWSVLSRTEDFDRWVLENRADKR